MRELVLRLRVRLRRTSDGIGGGRRRRRTGSKRWRSRGLGNLRLSGLCIRGVVRGVLGSICRRRSVLLHGRRCGRSSLRLRLSEKASAKKVESNAEIIPPTAWPP